MESEMNIESELSEVPSESVRRLRDRELIKPPQRYEAEFACAAVINEHQSYHETMNSDQHNERKTSMEEEMCSLKEIY
ncbi:hypothetical protein JTB14_030042 [Gonioctena quinquepunctata]|nr:hypothetical protein JTB14_030042 [Gonioctena quinquepunctata]